MPTPTEQNTRDLENLADRVGRLDEHLIELRSDFVGFRAAVETELGIIRTLGKWLLGGVFGAVAALITGAATIGWAASTVVSEVKHQADRIDRMEKRFDGLDAKLDAIIIRPAPGPGPAKGR